MMNKHIKTILFISITAFGSFQLYIYWPEFKDLFSNIFYNQDKIYIQNTTQKIKDDPNNHWNYIYRGTAYIKLKEYRKALNDFQTASTLKPNYWLVNSDISNCYLLLGDIPNAYKYINKIINQRPNLRSFYYDLAIIQDFENKNNLAIKTYAKYLKNVNFNNSDKLLKRDVFALKRRAINYIKINEINKSLEDLKLILKIIQNDEDAKSILELIENNKIYLKNSRKFKSISKINVHEACITF